MRWALGTVGVTAALLSAPAAPATQARVAHAKQTRVVPAKQTRVVPTKQARVVPAKQARVVPAKQARVVSPPAGARWTLQLGGAYPPAAGVRIADRDHHEPPAPGLYNLCYLNAFQAQADELAWWRRAHRSLLLYAAGRAVIDREWNEQLLDTSTEASRSALARIIGGWIDGCARAGFQAVDPDNLDSWQRSHGRLDRRDNLALARLLILRAHRDGLAIGQKNTPDLGGAGRRLGFDFALSEECQAYDECAILRSAYGREVLEVEYTRAAFTAACRARGRTVSVELRDLQLVPAGRPGHVERWCRSRAG